MNIKYPYDPTGNAKTNLVTTVKTLPRVRNRAFAPDGGPFYKDSVTITDMESGELIPKDKYDVLYLYSEASKRVGAAICAIINVHDTNYYGQISVKTQVIGGEFSSNVSAIQRMLETLEIDNRSIRFDDLIDVPVTMPPSPHLTYVGDLYGAEAVVKALENINNTNVEAGSMVLDIIKERYDTVYQLLLDLMDNGTDNTDVITALRKTVNENYIDIQGALDAIRIDNNKDKLDLATKYDELKGLIEANAEQIQEALLEISKNATAISVNKTAIANLLSALNALTNTVASLRSEFNAHVADKGNPHGVTKAQVGLGSVQNYPVGTIAEIRAGTASRYVQASVLKSYMDERISAISSTLSSHTGNRSNPHAVTKAQVGLSNVINYGLSSKAQAEAGTSNSVYMTPLRVKEAIAVLAGNLLNAHVNNKSNPHAVTKAQVGLGSVTNWAVGSLAEMRAGTASRYAASNVVTAYVNERVATVTKSSIGLSQVANYRVATLAEARAGSSSSLYMTPAGVKAAILAMSGSGDEWELKTADGGKWGILRNKNSLISLQWGQTFAMGINQGCRCSFFRPFVGLPFTVVGSSHSWSADTDEWAQSVEVYAHIVSKSITSNHFTAGSQRIWGGSTDGVVMSWIAVGLVSSTTDPTTTDVANRAMPVSDFRSYMGTPSTTANLVAPRGGSSSGGGGGGGGGLDPGGCLLPDVEVTLFDGTTKLAGEVKVGDKLLATSVEGMIDGSNPDWRQWSTSIDGAKLNTVGVTVTKVTPNTFGSHFVINDTLKITTKHEILVVRNDEYSWMDAVDIAVGDHLLDIDNVHVKVTSIELVDGITDVVDFDVEETDTYFAGGYLVHNAETKILN